jgi:cation diffusion facilitator CzcD-associated flavoprotein CzcO
MEAVDDRRNRYLVLGAGPVGLAVAQSLGAAGLPYDQVDAADGVGGNWHHGVYKTAHIISSRKVTQYSHFPMPQHYPDFPSGRQMLAYLESFAEHFDLHRHLELGRKVVYIRPVEESLWRVYFENGEERLYRGVLLCNGHHWCRRWPELEGSFDGELIHSKDYKDPEQLRDRRVLVIGGGNSACDVAAEAARVGRSCDLSLRSGVWFLPKTFFGVPLTELITPWMPVFLQRLALRAALRIVVGRYESYGLPRPDHRIFERLVFQKRQGRVRRVLEEAVTALAPEWD